MRNACFASSDDISTYFYIEVTSVSRYFIVRFPAHTAQSAFFVAILLPSRWPARLWLASFGAGANACGFAISVSRPVDGPAGAVVGVKRVEGDEQRPQTHSRSRNHIHSELRGLIACVFMCGAPILRPRSLRRGGAARRSRRRAVRQVISVA